MKLWIIIYTAGKIGGVIGPLPYGETECQDRVLYIEEGHQNELKKHQMEFACEWHDVQPKLDPSLP